MNMEWLANLLNREEITALQAPLLLDSKGQPLEGMPGPDLKAFLDPTLYLSDGRVSPGALLHRPHPLDAGQMQRAAAFTHALYKLLNVLTGHSNVTIATFRESLIASTGIFAWYEGQFVGVYKKQPHIGRGSSLWRIGRPGGFILPEHRKLVAEVTHMHVERQLGWDMPLGRLRKWGPDHLMERLDYDMTWRNRNYGYVFSYDVTLDEGDFAQITQPVNGKPVLVLQGNEPQPDDSTLDSGTYARVLRLMRVDDLQREAHGERLSLEDVLPRIYEIFAAQ